MREKFKRQKKSSNVETEKYPLNLAIKIHCNSKRDYSLCSRSLAQWIGI